MFQNLKTYEKKCITTFTKDCGNFTIFDTKNYW